MRVVSNVVPPRVPILFFSCGCILNFLYFFVRVAGLMVVARVYVRAHGYVQVLLALVWMKESLREGQYYNSTTAGFTRYDTNNNVSIDRLLHCYIVGDN